MSEFKDNKDSETIVFGMIADIMGYLDEIDPEESEIVQGYFFNDNSISDLSKDYELSKREIKEILKRHFFQIHDIAENLIYDTGISPYIYEYIRDMCPYSAFEFLEDCKGNIQRMAEDIADYSKFNNDDSENEDALTPDETQEILKIMLKKYNKISKDIKITEYYNE